MDIWKEQGITGNNSSEHKCYEEAYLNIVSESGIIKKKFKFETVSNEMFQETQSIMNMEYTKKTKVIFTPYHWLPFCRNAKVEFADGELLTIRDFILVNDSSKALGDGKGIRGLQIVF